MTSVRGPQRYADWPENCGPLWRRNAFRSVMERLAQFRFVRIVPYGRPRRAGGPKRIAVPATGRGKTADPEGAAAEQRV